MKAIEMGGEGKKKEERIARQEKEERTKNKERAESSGTENVKRIKRDARK